MLGKISCIKNRFRNIWIFYQGNQPWNVKYEKGERTSYIYASKYIDNGIYLIYKTKIYIQDIFI